MKINTREDRAFLKAHIKAGDRVRVGNFDWHDDDQCESCDYEIGVDEYMYDLEEEWVVVSKILPNFACSCGATAFNAEGWMWSTCWVVEYELPTYLRKPQWEV